VDQALRELSPAQIVERARHLGHQAVRVSQLTAARARADHYQRETAALRRELAQLRRVLRGVALEAHARARVAARAETEAVRLKVKIVGMCGMLRMDPAIVLKEISCD